ncbi:MAG TPA: iron ABC transporter permease [Candidatus Polarisedimenticolia bacterium]|nr:iron ABC transporter permease [Candidatus Polarisedimenticolia bacterium]
MTSHRLTPRRLAGTLLLLSGGLAACSLLALAVGSSRIAIPDMLRALSGHTSGADISTILFQVRLPRILLAALTGAALSCAGCTFQAVLRNPLADPYILGISGGAALGAILSSMVGLDRPGWVSLARPACAFAGAGLTVLLILALARTRGATASTPMLLIGWVFNSFFLALILFLETAVDFSKVRGAIFWLVGTLSPESYPVLAGLAVPVCIGGLTLWLLARDFDLICAGEDTARQMGCNVERTRLIGILIAALMTAAVVSFSGLIGFVGLIVPHATRLLFGPGHRLLVPASALLGATGLVLADVLSRTLLAPTEIPVGVLTVLAGGPGFVLLYRRYRAEVTLD